MDDKFKVIQSYFNKKENIVRDTEKGIFGTSDLIVVYKFFEKINLRAANSFVDIGSGDGRVVCVASLFTKAIGIEFDKVLFEESREHSRNLGCDVLFVNNDYEDYDFSDVNVLFSYSDHAFSERFIEKLKKDFSGTLYVYGAVFLPKLRKGKTIWIEQTPIVSYKFL